MKQQFNRNSWEIEHHNRKLKRFEVSDRKAETRTKVQLGGLILKAGLAELLEIEPGNDLQLDPIAREKATTLLGILLYAAEQLKNDHEGSFKQECDYRGKKSMIQQFLKSKDHAPTFKSNTHQRGE